MNTMANMANMNNMGGPVGTPMMMNNGAMPPQPAQQRNMQSGPGDSSRTLLNTYIYEYFMHYGMYDCARSLYNIDPQINVKKGSPGARRDENGNMGGGQDHPMDGDSKDGLDLKRPDDLPAPAIPNASPDSCFLLEWFSIFWSIFEYVPPPVSLCLRRARCAGAPDMFLLLTTQQ